MTVFPQKRLCRLRQSAQWRRPVRKTLEEIAQDIDEGAEVVMFKPALTYRDIIRMARDVFALLIAAYQVAGECSLIKATAKRRWIDEPEIALETLLSIKRAGADIILTYFAKEAAKWLSQ